MEFIENNLGLLFIIVASVISISVAILLFLIRGNKKEDEVLEARKKLVATEKKMYGINKTSMSEYFKLNHSKKYSEIQVFLSKYGVNYNLKRVVNPIEYLLVKGAMAIIFAILGAMFFGVLGFPIGAVVGYLSVDSFVKFSNNADNKEIMQDIRAVYETLKIRTESGVFLTKAIETCFMVVENERLKSALMTLGTELTTTNNVKTAVDSFQLKFKNRYVDQLCLTIRQGYESGSTLNSLTDISQNLANMQKSFETEMKSKLEWEIMITQLLLLIAIIGSIMFVVFASMMEGLAS